MLGIFAAAVGIMLIMWPAWLRPYLIGAAITSVPWVFTWFFAIVGNTHYQRLGAEAERWTATELRRLRRAGFEAEHSLQFDRDDVDHVLIGPAGVYVIETKWSSKGWQIHPDRLESPCDPITQIDRGMRHVRALLRAHGIVHTPTRIVALWGATTGEPSQIDGVWVMYGERLADALPPATPLTDDELARALPAVRAFARRSEQPKRRSRRIAPRTSTRATTPARA